MTKSKLVATIGFEIHVELATNSKMFCGCPAKHFSVRPNTLTCPVCLGLPGALPVPNEKAIESALMIALALNCKVQKNSKFDRKHYFYPDLPKGYQISQYDEPLATQGWLKFPISNIKFPMKKMKIRRVHIEEDTGKLLHQKIDGENVTLVDFNRSGVPLVEIVTEPDIESALQAKEFAQKLQQIIRYLEVSDCDMEKGSMRLEANVSWGLHLGYKVEVKNLNSFKFLEKAINYELQRQMRILDAGKVPEQETRGWSEKEAKTLPQRFKETEADYRYFPEPDIPPMEFDLTYVKRIKSHLPQLPDEIYNKFVDEFKIRETYARILVTDRTLAQFSEKILDLAKRQNLEPDEVAGFIVNQKISATKFQPQKVIDKFKKLITKKEVPEDKLSDWINKAIKNLPKAVLDYQKGKLNALSVLIGRVMQLSKGEANAIKVKKLLEEKLQR